MNSNTKGSLPKQTAKKVELPMGLEPMTARLSDGNSYQLNYLPVKWEEQDSNLYRMELQPIALPLELSSQKRKPPALIRQVVILRKAFPAYTSHNPHILIKARQIIQFLILHQN